MAFVLDPAQSVPGEVRRVAHERLGIALLLLEGLDEAGPAEVEEAVHQVRKRCKESRALARLVRQSIGPEFERFNDSVRRAAEELSSIRDAHAVLATFDELREASDQVSDADLDRIRSIQVEDAALATQGIVSGDPRIRRAHKRLHAASKRVRKWAVDDGFDGLGPGLGVTYQRGRRELKRAERHPTDERLHEWRKSVKNLWYQVRLLQLAAPSVLNPLVAQLDDLAEALGDDHDLAVLIERLEAKPGRFGGRKRVRRAVELARRQQGELRRRAFRLGWTLYAEPVMAFTGRVGAYWQAAVENGPELATGGIAALAAVDQPGVVRAKDGPERLVELERKFLVTTPPPLRSVATGLRQGYLAIDHSVSVRVRDAGPEGCTLTLKAGRGRVRTEFEWPISRDQFDAAWGYTEGRRVDKSRYRVPIKGGHMVDLDVFHDELQGLVIAEVEFETTATMDDFEPPGWFGAEVTDDPTYSNAALASASPTAQLSAS